MSLLSEVLKSGALPRELLEGHPAGIALCREIWRDFDKVVAYQHATDAMTEQGRTVKRATANCTMPILWAF